MAKALNRMRALFPKEFDFYPRTWTLPAQLDAFRAHCEAASERGGRPPTYIVKPSGGSQGTGIYLVRQPDQLKDHSTAVVQDYVESPLLLEGLKFDFRLYVLVLSVQPLTCYLYKGGMARFATSKYKRPTDANLNDVFMHVSGLPHAPHAAALFAAAPLPCLACASPPTAPPALSPLSFLISTPHAYVPRFFFLSPPCPRPRVGSQLTNYSLNKRNVEAYVPAGQKDAAEGSGEESDSGEEGDDDDADDADTEVGRATAAADADAGTRRHRRVPASAPRTKDGSSGGNLTAAGSSSTGSSKVGSHTASRAASRPASRPASRNASRGTSQQPSPRSVSAWEGDEKENARAAAKGGSTAAAAHSSGEEESDDEEESCGDESEEESSDDESEEAEEGDDGQNASKRSVDDVLEELVRKGLVSGAQVRQLWKDIEAVVGKTLVCAAPPVAATYSGCFPGTDPGSPQFKCFHIIGVDIMLDAELKPWLLEVNHNPSFTCDTPFDRELKGSVVRDTLELLDLKPFDKAQYKEQLAHHMAAKEVKHAQTPLEKERLQQQLLKERRAAAMNLASKSQRVNAAQANAPSAAPPAGSSAAAASAAAAAPAAAAPAPAPAPPPEFNPPASHGAFDRIKIGGAGAAHARYQLFQAANLQRAWRHCVGVRGRKLTAMRFQRLIRDAGLLEPKFSAADVDLLFMQTMMRSGVPIEDVTGVGFHEFCDALVEVAKRKAGLGNKSDSGSGGGGGGVGGEALAAMVERVVLALPGAAEAAEKAALYTEKAAAVAAASRPSHERAAGGGGRRGLAEAPAAA